MIFSFNPRGKNNMEIYSQMKLLRKFTALQQQQ